MLRIYDVRKNTDLHPVAELPEGTLFTMDDGRIFKKGKKRVKRFECIEVKSGLKYSVSALSEVKIVQS